ncbi:hypothetical protein MADA3029_270048 [Vibrio nigripulchritudo MADA3029]|uniref:glycosyltransferase n=1 Tax=Vibrio nigripulchritudo TaxID=28173 RepID=UPI0003B23D69|nr:glycosyltransferase [Vibrio nigripulchritudo]CCN47612.1 hypothetical protein VIBNIMADA3020_420048 [Vibrio nigripulchritudo MADA3020]CCN56564.1 hypothetical protein VIBNIMADA3021_970059 [Vibrio nigripulchritudo MADA3021]CCN58811.1 hypothetical protein MADA3029_270048 [Vibrio nigripulchritudo MADA3029]
MKHCNNFVVLFPNFEEVHKIKDVGSIPEAVGRVNNWQAIVACNSPPELDGEQRFKYSKIEGVSRLNTLNSLYYLFLNRNEIDLVNLYHLCFYSVFLSIFLNFLKIIGMWEGKIYLKLDISHEVLNSLKKPFKRFAIRGILSLFDIVSCEVQDILREIETTTNYSKLVYIPNSADRKFIEISKKLIKKKQKLGNGFISVARHGTYQKNSKELVRGYLEYCKKSANPFPLYLVGEVKSNLLSWLDNIEDSNVKNIKVIGNLDSREELINYYLKSCTLVLSSRWEGYPLVLEEAANLGLSAIMSDSILAAKDAFDKKLLTYYRLGNIEELANAFYKHESISRKPIISSINNEWDIHIKKILR